MAGEEEGGDGAGGIDGDKGGDGGGDDDGIRGGGGVVGEGGGGEDSFSPSGSF